jgi:putative peptide zinc metalloprotease protein
LSAVSEDLGGVYELMYNPHYKPERSPRSSLKTMAEGSKQSYVLSNGVTHEYYEVDDVTAAIWQLMDGKRTTRNIHAELSKQFPDITEKAVRDTLVSLAEEGTLSGTEPEVVRKRVNVRSPFQVDMSLTERSSSELLPLYHVLRPLFRRPVLIAILIFILAGFTVFSSVFFKVLASRSDFQILGSVLLGWLFYNLVALLPVYAVHEIAHALACMHYGGTPGEMGTGLFYFSPMFYADTSDSWRLGRWARVMVSMAGPISTLMIGSILALVSLSLPSGPERAFVQLPAFLCFYGTLFNLSPVIENDGYYALSDVLSMPNLREDSFSYLWSTLGRILGSKRGREINRHRSRKKAILLSFSALAGGWLVLFLYTTSTLMFYLAQDASRAVLSLGTQLASLRFDFTAGVVDVVLILYFLLLLSGYALLLKSSVTKLRRRRLKLETIHDKFVAVFMPLPTSLPSKLVREFVGDVKAVASKFSHSYTVEWKAPFCAATLKMGRAQESLEEIRAEMRKKEKAFQDIHTRFLRRKEGHLHRTVGVFSPGKVGVTNLLIGLSRQISGFSGSDAESYVSEFISRQQRNMIYFLHSAVSSIWALEVSPEDYRRFQTTIFPALLAEDFSETDLFGEVEEFKKHTILGLDTISELAARVEKEAGEVHKKIGVYQAVAYLEPIRGRLVFVGRTEELKRSTLKIARLFLIQNWSGYFDEVLKEANIGLAVALGTMKRTPSRHEIAGLRDNELSILSQNLRRAGSLQEILKTSVQTLESDYEKAMSAHKEISTLVNPGEGNVDVGYFDAAMSVNNENLMALTRRISEFKKACEKLFQELTQVRSSIEEEFQVRSEKIQRRRKRIAQVYLGIVVLSAGTAAAGILGITLALYAGTGIVAMNAAYGAYYYSVRREQSVASRVYTPVFGSIETVLLSTLQSTYEVVTSADLLT